MTKDINNHADVLDSRDIIERIEELEEEQDRLTDAVTEAEAEANNHASESEEDETDEENTLAEAKSALAEWTASDEGEELKVLVALQEEAEGYCPDWKYGAGLIRDSYFKAYAQELAEDCGMLKDANTWPGRCIDWDQAAEELKQDYTSVDFDGVDYWIR